MPEVALTAHSVDRALTVRRRVLAVADVMVARQEAHRQVEPVMQRAGRREVAFGRRAVERYVAGVEHEVGPVGPQCLADANEVVDEERLLVAEMTIGNLRDTEGQAASLANRCCRTGTAGQVYGRCCDSGGATSSSGRRSAFTPSFKTTRAAAIISAAPSM